MRVNGRHNRGGKGGVVLARREVLATTIALAVAPTLVRAAPEDVPEATIAAMAKITQGAEVGNGRVVLTMPKLAENGRSVPLALDVDSPMSDTDFVRSVYVFAGKNPITTVARFHFGAHAGVAHIKTRIRLADTQQVVALAEMSDGSFWAGQAHVVVTLGGCLDPVL